MKLIIKGEEPRELSTWKSTANANWQPDWDNFAGEVKQTVRSSLLKEQGHICCYCCRRIAANNSHFEHFRPGSSFPKLELDYHNMLASCQRNLEPEEPRHCGVLKDDWYDENLTISPLQENCETRFRYTANGGIYPADENDEAACDTIRKLGLGINKLTALRHDAIEGILDDIETLDLHEIRKLIEGFQRRDKQERFTEFCTALIYILHNYMGS